MGSQESHFSVNYISTCPIVRSSTAKLNKLSSTLCYLSKFFNIFTEAVICTVSLIHDILNELNRNDSFSCWCIHFHLRLPVQHLVSRGLRSPVIANPGWSVTRPIPFQLSNRCKHINIHTQTHSPPLPSTANTQHTVVYLVCGPLYLHRHDEVCITNRLQGRTQREMVGMLIHMSCAVYIHMALHNWTFRNRLHVAAINHSKKANTNRK